MLVTIAGLNLRTMPTNKKKFFVCVVYDYAGKQILARAIEIQ